MISPGLVFLLVFAVPGVAADIDGTVVIKRKLTRSKVTTSASTYQRGTAVPLAGASDATGVTAEYRRVVLFLEGDLPAARPLRAVIEQKNRQFIPDTVAIPAGSSVSFPNLDPIFHNVFSLSKSKSFDLGNYAKDQTRVVVFNKPGIVFVNCHLHPNMATAILVTPNSWIARADEAGRFRFPSLPAGTYTVVAWHKAAGFFRKKVNVKSDGRVSLEFLIPLEETDKPAVARR